MPIDDGAKKAFRILWVTGTLGTYFIAVIRKLLNDFFGVPAPPPGPPIGDLLVRYGYVLWFLTYFFVTNLRLNRNPEKWDLLFDVIQAGIGLSVAFALGFLDQQQGFSFAHQAYAVIVSNAGIIVIAGLAWWWFPNLPKVNALRLVGAAVAAASGGAAYLGAPSRVTGVLLVGLWVLLVVFVQERPAVV
jgi:hypothetical protein